MTWDPEKYREKREKVLGVKKRGLSFGTLTIVVSCIILSGMIFLILPGALSYLKTRHLDDAIFKMENHQPWPKTLVTQVAALPGVSGTSLDTHDTRLVVTFDRRSIDPEVIEALFTRHGLDATLLNRESHRQRMAILESEKEQENETL
ncbi:MAG: hypothetical protein AB1Z16_12470 [Desulfotignum sp.]